MCSGWKPLTLGFPEHCPCAVWALRLLPLQTLLLSVLKRKTLSYGKARIRDLKKVEKKVKKETKSRTNVKKGRIWAN